MSTRPITDTLRHINGGGFLDQASDQLAELVSAVSESSGKAGGKIVLEIGVRRATRGGAMIVTGKVTTKLPAAEPMEAMLFALDDGNLVADDPRQQTLELRSVATTGVDPDTLITVGA